MTRAKILGVTCLLPLAVGWTALAPDQKLQLQGRVVAEKGPVPQYPVAIWPERGLPLYALTDSDGMYSVSGLDPGNYVVRSVPNPYRNITVVADGRRALDLSLPFRPLTGVSFGRLPADLKGFLERSKAVDAPGNSGAQLFRQLPAKKRAALLNTYAMASRFAVGATTLYSFFTGAEYIDDRLVVDVNPSLFEQIQSAADKGTIWKHAGKPHLPDRYRGCTNLRSYHSIATFPTLHLTFMTCNAAGGVIMDVHFHKERLPIRDGAPGAYASLESV